MGELTLGSFFDGVGTWLLSASQFDIKPVWSSEIDPFPAAVSHHHFPDVKQLGDITKIKVDELEPVDIICAGSPCQDLSVAGKRAGLEGERSGLFRTAVDIVHRLRERTGKPRFFVWENVPGAFSSNKGFDFRAVLEEITKTEIPMPRDNKWAESGYVEWGGTSSLAWRTLDAQYWGVPQRRKRIFLVADFAGKCAGEILFIEQGLHGHITQGEGEREEAARNARESVDSTSRNVAYSFDSLASNSMKSKNPHSGCREVEISRCLDTTNPDPSKNQGGLAIYDMTHHDEVIRAVHGNKTQTLKARMGTGGNNTPILHVLNDQGGSQMNVTEDKAGTLRAEEHGHQPVIAFEPGIASRDGGHIYEDGKAPTLRANPGDNATTIYALEGNGTRPSHKGAGFAETDKMYTLNTTEVHGVAVGFRASGFQDYEEDKVAGTLRAQGGTLGGGSETFIAQKTVGCLNAADYKGINNQYVSQGKLVVDNAKNSR